MAPGAAGSTVTGDISRERSFATTRCREASISSDSELLTLRMTNPRTPAPDIGPVPITRFRRFAIYHVRQFEILIAIVNAHYDVVLVQPQGAYGRYTVLSVKQGGDAIDVPEFVHQRVEERIAGKRETMRLEAFWRLQRGETYAETRHLLEDIASLHGVLCTDLPAKGRAEYPSIDTISGPGFFLRRGDVERRGSFIHSLLDTLCGGPGPFCVRRGNVFLHDMLTELDCKLVLQNARNAVATVPRGTACVQHLSCGSMCGAPCVPLDTVPRVVGRSSHPRDADGEHDCPLAC